jgi:hypothetical protein
MALLIMLPRRLLSVIIRCPLEKSQVRLIRIDESRRRNIVLAHQDTTGYPLTECVKGFVKARHLVQGKVGSSVCLVIVGRRLAADMVTQM